MDLSHVKTLEDLKQAKAKFYAAGSEIKKLQAEIRTIDPKERGKIGKQIAELKENAERLFAEKAEEIKQNEIKEKIDNEWIDVTYPLKSTSSLHPLTLIENRFREWFKKNGFNEVTGSEFVDDEYNFERLNLPKDHPARDMQDSLYLKSGKLLRTHNTGFSALGLKENANKAFNQFAIGPVYRNDEDDATHSHQFTQIDIVSAGDVTFGNLLYILKSVLSYVLEEQVKVRLRPSFFPFTEPSVEVDIFYQERWIEVLGAGMFHPNVMKAAGYTNGMHALAAGIGVERIAMIKYGITNIREFYKNDLRFIDQFKGGR